MTMHSQALLRSCAKVIFRLFFCTLRPTITRCNIRLLVLTIIVIVTGCASVSTAALLWRMHYARSLSAIPGDNEKLLTFYSTVNWGIGNHMFAFASTLSIAARDAFWDGKGGKKTVSASLDASLETRWMVCIGWSSPLRVVFDRLRKWPLCEPNDVIDVFGGTRLAEAAYGKFDRELINNLYSPPFNHAVLDRFLQSWKYFDGRELNIRALFRFSPDIESEARAALADSIEQHLGCVGCYDSGDVISVGVHVRRGDMEEDLNLRNFGYKTADVGYLIRAMNYMSRKLINSTATAEGRSRLSRKSLSIVFVVVSDDIKWCKENLQSPRKTDQQIVFVSTRDPFVDMAVLAQCRHSIITVGSFGWWSAWLANGTTIYFSDWPRRGSALDRATSHSDYFYPHWIPLR